MGLGRPKVALILTDEERLRLDSFAHRSRTAPDLARRARIILACAEGHDNKAVAKRLDVADHRVEVARAICARAGGRFIERAASGSPAANHR